MSLVPSDIASELTDVGLENWNAILAVLRNLTQSRIDLGGSLSEPFAGTAYDYINHSKPWVAPATIGTETWKLRALMVTSSGAVTCKCKLYDHTASADVASSETGDCSGTSRDFTGTNQNYTTGALTLVAGHLYEVKVSKSAATAQCKIVAFLEKQN